MTGLGHRQIVIGLTMVMAAGLAIGMTPAKHLVKERYSINLESMIPHEFGEWKQLRGLPSVLAVDPREGKASSGIYDQVIMRTYENSHGNQVMLAVAYVAHQSEQEDIHRPEVCYEAQGFHLTKEDTTTVKISGLSIPMVRLVAVNGRRIEPITYWMTVGDYAVASGISRKLAQLRYGISGTIADGMLLRISSVTSDEMSAYALHLRFIEDLFGVLSESDRLWLAGEA
jgi:EpsI family protein